MMLTRNLFNNRMYSSPDLGGLNEKPIACWEVLWRRNERLVKPGTVLYTFLNGRTRPKTAGWVQDWSEAHLLLNNLAGVHITVISEATSVSARSWLTRIIT